MTHQLLCVENRDDAFVEAVRDVIAHGGRRLAFLPFDERARHIVQTLGPAFSNCELWAFDSPENSALPAAVRPLPAGERADAILVPIDSGEKLGAALLQLLDLDCGTVIIPQTEWYFKNRPLFLISIPKAGTHLLYELAQAFGYDKGIVANSATVRPGHWYCVEYSNSHTRAPHFFIDSVHQSPFGNRDHPFMRSPAIFIYRNPRDVVVSEANYSHKDGNSALAPYWARFSPEERLLRLIDDPWLLGNFRDRMAEFVPWLEMPNVIPISFEELVGPNGGGDATMQRRLIWSLQLKLQVPGNPDAFAAQVFNAASPTFFAGRIGAWHERFSPEVEKRYSALPQDFEYEFGYARPADGTLPIYSTRIDEFSRRKLSFSKADFSSVPIAQEYGFLGFNLVSFGGRVYALAESLGSLDLATMSSDELAGLPSAKTLDEAKYLAAFSRLKPVETEETVDRGMLLENLKSLQTSQDETRREFQMQKKEMQEEHRLLRADLLETRQTLERMQESMFAREGELADRLKQTTEALKQTTEALKQTTDIVHSHSRMWERLARSWPIRVLLNLSKSK